ncbi:MAG: ABC transporter substrate-binding protein [Eubacteriales bacterium]
MKRKLISILLTASLVASLLVGCGGTEEAAPAETATEEAAPAEEATEEVVEVVEETVDISGTVITAMVLQSQYIEQLENMVFKFEDEYDVTFDVTVVPDEQYLSLLEMRIANGEMPDIVQYNVPHIYNVIDASSQLYDWSNSEWASKLVDPSLSTVDGGIYSFTFKATSGNHCMIYNKDIFDALGLEEPSTVEEFDQLCDDLLAADVIPVMLTSDSWVPQIWTASGFARAFGTEEAALEMTEQIFTGQAQFSDYEELCLVIDDMLALRDKGYLNDDFATLGWDDAWAQIAAEEAAMILGEGPMVGQFQSTYPDTNFGVFNVPTSYDPNCDYISGAQFSSGLVVNKDSENIAAIEVMFNAFATPEYGDMYFADENAGFPAIEGIDGGEMNEDVQALYEEYLASGGLVPEMNTAWAAIESLFSDYLWAYYAEALVKGELDGAGVLDKFQSDFDKFQKNSGVEGF